MDEAFVQLRCPACQKDWEETPTDLPVPGVEFTCPDCSESRRLSEFMRTDRDLEILEEFAEA
jgi:predicted RNA-binding Zn-ribbon protein involved in translation (DUF1610 family)